ncbi:hypothetical protein V2J09_021593 [Rumex salicifolius]
MEPLLSSPAALSISLHLSILSKVKNFSIMGAPKQKWTAEEEEALKAGVRKHGTGKWQTILKDPEFNHVLSSRSNVDLKDKWRNINVTASGLGSREKARLALKKTPQTPKNDDKSGTSNNLQGEENVVESKSHSVPPSGEKGQASVSVSALKRSFTRLESVIVEAITALKEPRGSDKSSIATYIKENYWEPPDFKKLVSSKLKFMTLNGKLVKANHRYKTALRLPPSHTREEPLMNDKQKDAFNVEKSEVRIFRQPEVDAELDKMKCLPAHEAAAAAARAVVEAEAAIAEAEKAAREAEAAEAEAEAAQIFAQAAMKACQKLKRDCNDPSKLDMVASFAMSLFRSTIKKQRVICSKINMQSLTCPPSMEDKIIPVKATSNGFGCESFFNFLICIAFQGI